MFSTSLHGIIFCYRILLDQLFLFFRTFLIRIEYMVCDDFYFCLNSGSKHFFFSSNFRRVLWKQSDRMDYAKRKYFVYFCPSMNSILVSIQLSVHNVIPTTSFSFRIVLRRIWKFEHGVVQRISRNSQQRFAHSKELTHEFIDFSRLIILTTDYHRSYWW